MKLAVVGSRGFNDYNRLCKELDGLGITITLIISGGARGADKLARRYAEERGIEIKEHEPDWRPDGVYDNQAGIKRNVTIIDEAEKVVAFWDGKSPGTTHSIGLARGQGKLLKVVRYLLPEEGSFF